ncbi:MAG: gluconate 2-dehydrogenase subunit 3 family protein [Bryobacteraceae bacterium]
MRRRRVLQTVLGLPALPAAAAAQTAGSSTYSVDSLPKLRIDAPDAIGEGHTGFFSAAQFKALAALCESMAPATAASASALDAETPEFLDFLISQSPEETQSLYRAGLDRIAREGCTPAVLAPLTEAWTYSGPADDFARFLRQAKQDILQATFNSRAQAEASAKVRRRGGGGVGYYWRSLD